MCCRKRQPFGTPSLKMIDINREELRICRESNTHSVNEALQKPFGGINPCCHLLLVLQNNIQWEITIMGSSSLGCLLNNKSHFSNKTDFHIINDPTAALQDALTRCFLSFGSILERISSWWAWKRCSLGNPGMKNPSKWEQISLWMGCGSHLDFDLEKTWKEQKIWSRGESGVPCMACLLLVRSCDSAQKASSSFRYMSKMAAIWLIPWQ